jgi:RNA polymerase sigma-70 factor, ECF subfamily
MDKEWNDAELARRIGSGTDLQAEAELARRMAPRIRLYGLRHLRDSAAAEDLTQEVLITTLEALRAGRLREPEKLTSFVLGTCRMTVLDLRRGSQRKERLLQQFRADLQAVQPSMPVLDHRNWHRSAEFVYNHINCPPMVLWLGEAAGLPRARVAEAKRSVLSANPNHAAECSAIRRVLPWEMIESRLGSVKKRKPARQRGRPKAR